MQPKPESADHQARGADRRGQRADEILGIQKVLDAGEQFEIGFNPEDGAVRVIMTGNATDRPELQAHVAR